MMNSIIRDYSEKRDFIRMKVDTEIELVFKNSNKTQKAICKDLSGTGMQIETSDEIKAGTICETTLASTNTSFPSLEAKIKIIRCSPGESGNYLIGAEIIGIGS